MIDLADNELIDAILVDRPSRRRRSTAPVEFRRVEVRARCGCGKCATCADNSRWDRIFAEKFADPDYYKPRQPTTGSSLGWLR